MALSGKSSSRTTTSFVVLGLLSVRDWTTYELTQQMRRTVHWFWPRAERRIYDEPKALVAAGLATVSREYTGQRPRNVYAITPEGREALRAWLDEPSTPPTSEFEAMAKVFFAEVGELTQLNAAIDDIAATAKERIAWLIQEAERSHTAETQFPQRRHVNALAVRLQLEQEGAVLRWAQWARQQTADWIDTRDPGSWQPATALSDLIQDLVVLSYASRPGEAKPGPLAARRGVSWTDTEAEASADPAPGAGGLADAGDIAHICPKPPT